MKFVRCSEADENSFSGDHILLIPQYHWKNYRIDWAIKVTFLKHPYFFIECDGKDFHSSQEQIFRDRQKDEAVRSAGIQIFRFSGSELERNASACVKVVFAALELPYRLEWTAGFHRQAG